MTTRDRRFKEELYTQFARVGKALASPRRLELLDLLCQGPRTVDALAKQANQSLANTSQHLQILRAARLVEATKDGTFVRYRVQSEHTSELFRHLREVASNHLAEVDRITSEYLRARGFSTAVDRETLLELVQSGAATVIDVRPSEEYESGHIPRALSIPMTELEQRLADLPRERTIVAYCRGPFCVMAISAVELLREHGFDAHRLEYGVPEWRSMGYEITGGATA